LVLSITGISAAAGDTDTPKPMNIAKERFMIASINPG
jgi:hypothetical protein